MSANTGTSALMASSAGASNASAGLARQFQLRTYVHIGMAPSSFHHALLTSPHCIMYPLVRLQVLQQPTVMVQRRPSNIWCGYSRLSNCSGATQPSHKHTCPITLNHDHQPSTLVSLHSNRTVTTETPSRLTRLPRPNTNSDHSPTQRARCTSSLTVPTLTLSLTYPHTHPQP